MEKDIFFTVITPTINRTTLRQTCSSVDSQEYQGWEHLIVGDGISPTHCPKNPRRRIIITPKTDNYGNSQRHMASQLAKGKYLLYLDDDDYYITLKAFTRIRDHIIANKFPTFGIFPALRLNQKFFHIPPAASQTVSCQFFVKNGHYWPEVEAGDQDYGVDGRYIQSLTDEYGASILDCEMLVEVNRISKGIYL